MTDSSSHLQAPNELETLISKPRKLLTQNSLLEAVDIGNYEQIEPQKFPSLKIDIFIIHKIRLCSSNFITVRFGNHKMFF
jgi:hypothetical protein